MGNSVTVEYLWQVIARQTVRIHMLEDEVLRLNTEMKSVVDNTTKQAEERPKGKK